MQVVLLDDLVGPHAAHQFLFRKDPAAPFDEGEEHVERPPAEPYWEPIGQQFPAVAEDLKTAKFKDFRWFGLRGHGAPILLPYFRTF